MLCSITLCVGLSLDPMRARHVKARALPERTWPSEVQAAAGESTPCSEVRVPRRRGAGTPLLPRPLTPEHHRLSCSAITIGAMLGFVSHVDTSQCQVADRGDDAGRPPGVLVKRGADGGAARVHHSAVSRWQREGSDHNQCLCSRCVCARTGRCGV